MLLQVPLDASSSHPGLAELLPPERTPDYLSLQPRLPLLHGPAAIVSLFVRLFDQYLSPSKSVGSRCQEPYLQGEGSVQAWGVGILLGWLSLVTLPHAEYCSPVSSGPSMW